MLPYGLAGVLLMVAALTGCGGSARHTAAHAAALRAFTRPARAVDAWPSPSAPVAHVRDSRLIAELRPRGLAAWRLYVVEGDSVICLELLGVGGDCNTGRNLFANARFEVIRVGDFVAAAVANEVARVALKTPAIVVPEPLSRDQGILFECPGVTGCGGDVLLGYDSGGRVVFRVAM